MGTRLDDNISSAADRTIVITGGNSGIGRAAASMLAGMDARVVLAVRDLGKGRAAAESMRGIVDVQRLDLADLGSVKAFAENFTDPIDILINNAGIMVPPLGRTADGFELQFGTNHLGHFALTNLLLGQIRDRVVTVSSIGHRSGTIDFDDLNWERKPYKPMAAYGQSKLANLLFTSELQRRFSDASSSVIATAAHPGLAATNLYKREGSRVFASVTEAVIGLISQNEQQGALPTLCAATADIPGNSYVGPRRLKETTGQPTLVDRSDEAKDAEVARRLWMVSEELTGVEFPEM
ncbi:MAG: oxidoreductase [Brevibacterium aurantiacum]|uniref:NAD(P)-dependent dehydrogenase, short-chain alcohol dehydrogenase family n=1 Tax=Brevibacterium aurantiacum TaxID=273384 RepID=A0A2A3YQW8_BREAU|nr:MULTISPECIES: oxidoreductase [Brevibacterium]AZT96219.1 oxidoreductase [Brevibacterium aurantiacum]MDN5593398.1 oxidoreductase [Brevibacterium sp.]MDN5608205.1 oxidoreductase [Brevibacterium sp.]MDN5658261.1 oxidoreductase [Brevibacterium sandarakinum]MDN5807532.1 oxidoreductase [Brevibacterium sp.]